MGIICCAISGALSNIMYYCEKCAACFAATCLVTCIVITLLITLGLGIGLGYNYCFVDLKTRYRYQPPHYRVEPDPYYRTTRYIRYRTPTKVPRYGYPGEIRVTHFPGDRPRYSDPNIKRYPFSPDSRRHYSRAQNDDMYGPELIGEAKNELGKNVTTVSLENQEYNPEFNSFDNTKHVTHKLINGVKMTELTLQQDPNDIMTKDYVTNKHHTTQSRFLHFFGPKILGETKAYTTTKSVS